MKKTLTGIDGFDKVTNGGLPAGRPTLIAGGPGCGKSLFTLSCVASIAANKGQGAVFLSFEEQVADIIVNAESIGLDLEALVDKGTLIIDHIPQPERDTFEIGSYNLDGLLARLALMIKEADAKIFGIDTIETLFVMFQDTSIVRSELVKLFN
ncbi:MAG: AAA family ATPase, partial [Gammaproteobacteria bacterium]|nr:AAA family ATPase [Gammaproteobacteria bacterium]